MELKIGMTFTGSEQCFTGRVEILEIDEPNNRLRVGLTKKNDTFNSNWNEDWRNDTNLHIYSNSDSEEELENFIKERKSANVKEFKILHKASKEQDEMASKFIDEMLADGGF